MFSFLKKLLGRQKADVSRQAEILKSGDAVQLKNLAASEDATPEVLYFLAKNEDADIRKAVALNKSTPVQASTLLANDKSVDVRFALAARLVELLPELSADKHSQLYAYAVQALGMLAQDEVLMVRKALVTTLKDYAKAPPAVVSRLARDVEREISEPVLRFCVALSDDDLFDILGNHPEPWVISAIASRPTVSTRISEAVVDTQDVPGTTVLLNNAGASMSADTLQKIIDRARHYPEWHQPIVMRKELSVDLARQLTGFVSEAVMSVLERRGDFDIAARQSIAAIVKRRVEYQKMGAPSEAAGDKLRRFIEGGMLTAQVVEDALSWGEMDFVQEALAHLSGIHTLVVKKMLGTGAARPVVALCWKAGVPMRLCVEIQRIAAKIQPKDLMYAKGGTDYPLTPEEIKWQLEFFGVS